MNVCRTCLSKIYLEPIFQNGIDVNKRSSDLFKATGVKIKHKDGLSQFICDTCTRLINDALKLRTRSQNTEKLLKKEYKSIIEDKKNGDSNLESDDHFNSNLVNNYEAKSTIDELEYYEDMIDAYPNSISEYAHNDLPNFDNILDRIQLSPELTDTRNTIHNSGRRLLTIKDLESSDDDRNDVCEDENEWRISPIDKEKICMQKSKKMALSNAVTRKCMELAVLPYNRCGPVTCKICSKVLKNVPIFKCHAKTHFEPEFSCEMCGKKFVFNSVLRYHQQRVHGKLKRLGCSQCAYRAVDLQQLQNHIRASHTGERPYSCDVCGDTFRMRSTVAQHMRTHFGVRNVQCERCPAMFRSRSELAWHRNKVHLMTYTYYCYLCPQLYKNLGSVKKHLARIHGVPAGQHLPIKSIKELR